MLPSQHKKTKEPGDNKTMIHCRKDFLKKGFYDFLSPELIRIIRQLPDSDAHKVFLDSGCGEGYFTDQIKTQLNNDYIYYGMDISKEAVRLAAKRNKHIHWLVASSNNPPIANNSLDIVLKINAPLNYDNVRKKMTDNAVVISVTPGENHLSKLREHMYLKPQAHKQEETPTDFKLLQQSNIEKQIKIQTREDINNLFMMTPYYWNASTKVRQIIAELDMLETTAAFNINVYQTTNSI